MLAKRGRRDCVILNKPAGHILWSRGDPAGSPRAYSNLRHPFLYRISDYDHGHAPITLVSLV